MVKLTYAEVFVEIGKEYNVSPVMLASRCRQEQGVNGTSALISGTVEGYEGYYNYFNISASGKTDEEVIKNGLEKAKEEGWDTPYKSIVGGSVIIASQYVLCNQDTLYFQKFDVIDDEKGMYWHQYMGNLMAPTSEGRSTKKSYEELGVLEEAFVFKIPVYTDRPEENAPEPVDDTNPNNYLSDITLNDGEYALEFDYQTENYSLEVPFECEILNVAATTVSDRATLEGNGEYSLEVGTNEITLVVTAESGDVRDYVITVQRIEDEEENPDEGEDPEEPEQIVLAVPEIISVYSKAQTSAKVTWSVVEGATGYELFRSTLPEAEGEATSDDMTLEEAEEAGMWFRVKTIQDGAADKYTNQNLMIGETYYYKVRAYTEDEEGNRIYSDFSEISYMPAVVVWENVYSNAASRVRMLWNEVDGATGYQIYRQNEDGSYSIIKTLGDQGNELTDNQGATTAYSNVGVESGKVYTYKMRAFVINEDGQKIFGAYSDEYSVAVMPESPVLVGVSEKSGRAELSWDAVTGAAGYQIWMSESEDGEYNIVKSITDGSVISYTKYDLESGKTYYFKIRAYAELNELKTFGEYSEIIEVTVK